MGYSPRGCKELDTTELLHFHLVTWSVLTGKYLGRPCVQLKNRGCCYYIRREEQISEYNSPCTKQ